MNHPVPMCETTRRELVSALRFSKSRGGVALVVREGVIIDVSTGGSSYRATCIANTFATWRDGGAWKGRWWLMVRNRESRNLVSRLIGLDLGDEHGTT